MRIALALLLALLGMPDVAAADDREEANEKRYEIRQMGNAALERLLQLRPEVRDELARSVGFAAFDNVGVSLLVLSAASGHGLARETATGRFTYMKTRSLGGGLALGAKDYRLVLIFHDRAQFDRFLLDGLEVGTQTELSADLDSGASATIEALRGVTIYQITDTGLAAGATLQGTRYWRDPDLN